MLEVLITCAYWAIVLVMAVVLSPLALLLGMFVVIVAMLVLALIVGVVAVVVSVVLTFACGIGECIEKGYEWLIEKLFGIKM